MWSYVVLEDKSICLSKAISIYKPDAIETYTTPYNIN
jgi:hypothetical protein